MFTLNIQLNYKVSILPIILCTIVQAQSNWMERVNISFQVSPQILC